MSIGKTGNIYGYCRVSSKDQNEERQIIAMKEYGVEDKNIIVEKQSGKNFERPKYRKLISKLKKGDTLVIKSIDRLGRDYESILEEWKIISKEKQVGIVVLDMPLLDTRSERDLIGTLISDIVLQLLSYVAQTERELIHARQAEGIAAAKGRGVKFGRPKKQVPDEFNRVYLEWRDGKPLKACAKELAVAPQTFKKWALEAKRS